ncbi:MAG: hypothetical protein PHR78_07975 [Eubacteriales bacterium]|nr:hypothetical protein [Eubacteriales bacterium]
MGRGVPVIIDIRAAAGLADPPRVAEDRADPDQSDRSGAAVVAVGSVGRERAHTGSGQESFPSGPIFSFCSTSTLPHSGQMLSWQSGNSFLQTGQNIQHDKTGCELKNVLRIRPFWKRFFWIDGKRPTIS